MGSLIDEFRKISFQTVSPYPFSKVRSVVADSTFVRKDDLPSVSGNFSKLSLIASYLPSKWWRWYGHPLGKVAN